MGWTQAQGFAEAVRDGSCTLDAALHYHLTVNHYPPIPISMIPVCKRAIAKAKRGDWNSNVRLPKGVHYRGRKTFTLGHRVPPDTVAPVWAIVEQHHLDAFIEEDK